MIPYGRQQITDEDISAVVDVLKSDFLTQGPVVPAFEKAVCDYTGASYGIAVNSGTSALHIACLALGLEQGDRLWTTPITFVASANCGLYCGAIIDFIDIDPETWNISVECLREKLEFSKRKNRLPKIVVVVHLCGLCCDMEAIYSLSQEYGFNVIEDACHAIGGKYKNDPIGNCQYSDITVFSFHPVKNMTTGEGGLATSNDRGLADKMSLLRSHGITRDPDIMTQEPDGSWYYQQVMLGYNYRITDIQAALGRSQLKRLDNSIQQRHRLSDVYDELLTGLPIQLQHRSVDNYSAIHLYTIRIKANSNNNLHQHIFELLRKHGVGVNLHYIPIHIQPYFQSLGFNADMFPNSMQYYREAISLPMYVGLSEENISNITNIIQRSLT